MFITGQFHVVWQEVVCVRLRVRESSSGAYLCVCVNMCVRTQCQVFALSYFIIIQPCIKNE